MGKVRISFGCALLLLIAGLVCAWPAQAMAQAAEPPSEVDGDDAQTPSSANPPRYIGGLLKPEGLQQAQVDQMRADGWGWGEIRLAVLLAQQMATDGTKESFDAALEQIKAARAEGKGFGEIAAEGNLKVGQLVGNKKAGVSSDTGSAAKTRKPGFFARLGKALGFGRSADKPAKPGTVEKSPGSAKAMSMGKPERSVRAERIRPEKPVRLEKPSRPEKPVKGPNR